MKLRANNCHVEMKPDFLFDIHNKFKSFYSPWVYICIYLSDVNTVMNKPDNFFKTDTNLICKLLDTDPSTVSRAKDQLADFGLIEMKGHKIKVNHNKCDSLFEEVEGFKKFIKVNNNFLLDFLPRLKNALPDKSKKERTLVKTLQVYYYLIGRNRHYIVNTPIIESKETLESIKLFLHQYDDNTKKYLNALETIEQIQLSDEGKIFTKYNYGTRDPFKNNYNTIHNCNRNNRIIQINESEYENEKEEDFNHFQDTVELTFDTEPETRQEKVCSPENEEVENNTIENEDNQINPEPVTDKEKIERILKIADGDTDKTNELLKAFNISEALIREYLGNITEDQISDDGNTAEDDLLEEIKPDSTNKIEINNNENSQNYNITDESNIEDIEENSPYNEYGYVYITEDVDKEKLIKDFKAIDSIYRLCNNDEMILKLLSAHNISDETLLEFKWRMDHCHEIKEEDGIPALDKILHWSAELI